MEIKTIKLFLRLAISAGFLSAVADRFGGGVMEFLFGEIGITF